MSSVPNRSRSNPLIQRVRRHAGLATLFRAPLAAGDALTPAALPPAAAPSATALPRARAYALSTQRSQPAPAMPGPGPSNLNEPGGAPAVADSTPAAIPAPAVSTPSPVGAVRERPSAGQQTTAAPQTAAAPQTTAAQPVARATLPAATEGQSSAATGQPAAGVAQSSVTAAALPAAPAAPQSPATSQTDAARPVQRTPSGQPAAPPPVGAVRERPSAVQQTTAATQTAAAPQATAAQPVQRAPSGQPSAPASPAVQPAPPAIPQAPPAQGTLPEESKLSERDWSRLSTIMRRHQSQQGEEAETGSTPTSPTPTGVSDTDAVGAVREPPLPTPIPTPPPALGAIRRAPSDPPAASAGTIREAPPPTPPSGADADAAPTQPLGLEAAWPVQRRAIDTPQPAPQSPDLPTAPVPLAEQVRHAEHIQRALAGVSSGQPTGSRIEVIPPRQPRPAPTPVSAVQRAAGSEPQSPAESPAPPAQPEAGDQLPVDIQRSAAGPTSPAGPTASTPEPHPDQPPADGPRLVDTEIGPLPADLWGLLGQPAPGSTPAVQRQPLADSTAQSSHAGAAGEHPQPTSPQAPVPTGAPAPTGAAPTGASDAIEVASGPTAPAGIDAPITPSASNAPVQRMVIINDFETHVTPPAQGSGGQTPSGTPQTGRGPSDDTLASAEPQADNAPASGQTTGQTPGSGQPAGPDLDEIARQVYAEVKNRLQVEWERLRRRI